MSDKKISRRERLARALYLRYGRDADANWYALPDPRKDKWRQDAIDVLDFMEKAHV